MARQLALLKLQASALKLDIAAEQHGTTPAIQELARDMERAAMQVAMPVQTEMTRRRFIRRQQGT
jgi:hypothetical protein